MMSVILLCFECSQRPILVTPVAVRQVVEGTRILSSWRASHRPRTAGAEAAGTRAASTLARDGLQVQRRRRRQRQVVKEF